MEKIYSIEEGDLYNDLDCPYDAEANKIDVYTSVYWSDVTAKGYEDKEKIINDWKFENDIISAFSWCDISGFEYFNRMEEQNYVSIDVLLKKPVEQYTQEEIKEISDLISKWDEYFSDKLNN